MTDTEPLLSETVKKERSAAQLEALSKARVKAAEVRAKNTELRKKEREVVNAQLAENRRMREESIEREHAAKFSKTPEEEPASDHQPPAPPNSPVGTGSVRSLRLTTHTHSPEEEVVYEKKPKKKRRVVVVQNSSESEEEIEVKLPKQKKKPQVAEVDALYQRTYQRMFEL
jgi:hypothetical protein